MKPLPLCVVKPGQHSNHGSQQGHCGLETGIVLRSSQCHSTLGGFLVPCFPAGLESLGESTGELGHAHIGWPTAAAVRCLAGVVGLHLESTALKQASVLIKADIAEMAPAEALASTYLQLRAKVWERDLILDELEKERGQPILWLNVLGTLPDGVMLESAELIRNRWEIRGQTTGVPLKHCSND